MKFLELVNKAESMYTIVGNRRHFYLIIKFDNTYVWLNINTSNYKTTTAITSVDIMNLHGYEITAMSDGFYYSTVNKVKTHNENGILDAVIDMYHMNKNVWINLHGYMRYLFENDCDINEIFEASEEEITKFVLNNVLNYNIKLWKFTDDKKLDSVECDSNGDAIINNKVSNLHHYPNVFDSNKVFSHKYKIGTVLDLHDRQATESMFSMFNEEIELINLTIGVAYNENEYKRISYGTIDFIRDIYSRHVYTIRSAYAKYILSGADAEDGIFDRLAYLRSSQFINLNKHIEVLADFEFNFIQSVFGFTGIEFLTKDIVIPIEYDKRDVVINLYKV